MIAARICFCFTGLCGNITDEYLYFLGRMQCCDHISHKQIRKQAGEQIPTLTVQPFELLGPDQSQTYLAQGLTLDLITDLARLSALRVIGSRSIMGQKSDGAETVAARYRVQGEVQRSDGWIRVHVHLLDTELQAALHPRGLMERYAYRPEHWAHNPRWQPHTLGDETWFGLPATAPIRVGEAAFRLVPLPGHTRGHCAVALRTSAGWLLHCGDAYGYHRQVDPRQPYRHPNGPLLETLVTRGFNMPRRHWLTLRHLQQDHPGLIHPFCSHDTHEFDHSTTLEIY